MAEKGKEHAPLSKSSARGGTPPAKPSPKKALAGVEDPISQLYRAVQRYVESNGGNVLVIGGVQMQQWPGEGKFNFSIAVKCTGRWRKPEERAMPDRPKGER